MGEIAGVFETLKDGGTQKRANPGIWILVTYDVTVLPDITVHDIGVSRITQSPDSDIGVTDIGNSNITAPQL